MTGRIVTFLLLLIVAAMVAIICAMIFVNPNNYKSDINHLVQKYTGRDLIINGNIKWSLTPQVALGVQDIILSNPNNFTGPFLKVTEATIKLSLMDLFKGKIVIKGVSLQNPELYLTKTKAGTTNIDDLLGLKSTKHPKTQKIQGAQTKIQGAITQKENVSSILINDLAIKNGKVQWQDASNNNILLYNLNISSKGLCTNISQKLAPISISGNIKDLTNHYKDEVSFTTTINAKLTTQTVHLEPIQIQWRGINIFGKLTANANNNIINIDPITIGILGSEHQASVNIDLKTAVPIFSIKDKTNTFAIDKLLSTLAQFKKLHGETSITTALNFKGNQPNTLKSSLQGTLELAIQQGTFDGIDVHQLLKQTEATLHGLFNAIKNKTQLSNIPALLTSQVKDWKANQGLDPKTHFDVLHAKAQFQNGISQETNFTVQHSDYDIQGNGTINLVNETVNIKIKALYKNKPQAKDSDGVIAYMLKTPVTIIVQGSLYNPTIKVDLNTYCKEAIEKSHKELFKSVIKKTLNKIILKTNTNDSNSPNSNNPLGNIGGKLLDNLLKKAE